MNRVAVTVTLAADPDLSAFEHLVRAPDKGFANVEIVSAAIADRIVAREAADSAKPWPSTSSACPPIMGGPRYISSSMGPFPMAVLVGRYLNTFRTVTYEWDGDTIRGLRYQRTITIEPGVATGPITEVLM